jgi:hypothetical protein
MDCIITNLELKAVSLLSLLVVVASIWVTRGEPNVSLPGFPRAGLAFQLVGERQKIVNMLGELGSTTRTDFANTLHKDFVFIVIYGSFFLSLSLIASQANFSAAKWLGVVAVLCVLAAASADLVENYRMLGVLASRKDEITQDMAAGIRQASLFKWGLLFAAFGVLAVIFLLRMNLLTILGGLLALSAMSGFIGLRHPRLIGLALILMTAAILTMSGLFFFMSAKSLRAICGP